MKKLFALALVVFGLAACQTDQSDLDVQFDGNATVSLSIPADAVTRAGGSDSAASGLDNTTGETIRFILAVYDEKGVEKLRNTEYAEEGTLTATFPVRLVPGRKYTFVAWADMVDGKNAGDKHYNTEYLTNITLNGEWNAMDETRDAFTASKTIAKYSSTEDLNMQLTRPFAKLRVIATDVEAIKELGLEAKKVTIAFNGKVANSYNAFNQEVASTATRDEFTFDIAEYGDSKDGKLVLYTDYIFANEAQDAVKFSLTTREESDRVIKTVNFNTDIPVQRNMLTTLTGNVMTEGDNVTVKINDVFGDEDTDVTEYSGIINEPLVLPTGKYIFRNLNMNLSYDNAVIIKEDAVVTIDIVGNVNLTAAKEAIKVSEGAILTINGMQPTRSNNEQMGVVVADGGIGGDNVTININDIANLTAKGHGDHAFGIGGRNATVTINNTTIEYVSGGHVQALFVNDEKYGKSEPEGGAAIGGAIVNIENSTITKAEGGSKAAAIGNNYWQSTEVVITDSELGDIFGGNASAAIGGSRYSSDISAENKQSSKVKIENSTITNAVGGQFGAGIGSGYDTHCQANETNSVNDIIIINSTITAKGGKYAAGIGTGFHAASLTGSIDATSTINATYGEPFYKSTYTFAQHIGYGVIDLAREGADLNVTFTVNNQTIAFPGSLASYAVVMNIDEFNAALNATAEGDNLILFGADIEGNATVDQKENHNVVIDGCDYSYNGSIFIDGNSNNNNPETLTIQNINFYTEANEINFIDANNSANDVRYAHNVTINGCTFNTTGTDVVSQNSPGLQHCH